MGQPARTLLALVLLVGTSAHAGNGQQQVDTLLAANTGSQPCVPLLMAQLWTPAPEGLQRIAVAASQQDCPEVTQAARYQPPPASLPAPPPNGEPDWVLALDTATNIDSRAWHRSSTWRHDGSTWQVESDLLRAITPWEYQQFRDAVGEVGR